MAEVSEIEVDASTVIKVADLANLQLSSTDVAYFQTQLSRILKYASELNQLDLASDTKAPSERFAFESKELERDDHCQASLAPELALQNATKKEGTAFIVPRVID